ncbi:hypothetical protein D3C84_837420 [compost metagenome]
MRALDLQPHNLGLNERTVGIFRVPYGLWIKAGNGVQGCSLTHATEPNESHSRRRRLESGVPEIFSRRSMQHGDGISVERMAAGVSMSQQLAEDVLQMKVDF